MSIVVNEVHKHYGAQQALNNVSFEIKTGEIVGFLGPNGAGKSTMMKILTGFIPQTKGSATVAGFDVTQEPLEVKRRVGYLPENNALYTDMYVREYLAFVAGTYGVSAKAVDARITEVGLDTEKHKKIGELSKGYRQRVGLAAALIHNPEVLILDEPTTGLDPNQLVDIRNLIKALGQHKTVMLSTHIMQEVEQLCQRVIIINKGQIVADKPIAELKQLNKTIHLSVGFSSPVAANQLKKVAGVLRVHTVAENRFTIETVHADATKEALFQFAVAQKAAITEIHEKEQQLEQIFHALTRA